MKILLTGSTGFIGSHIKKALDKKHTLITPAKGESAEGDHELIIHCAWAGTYKESPPHALEDNLKMFFALFKQNKPMIYFGSGIEKEMPDSNNPYHVGKYALSHIKRDNLLRLTPYVVYGKGEDPSRLIPTAIREDFVTIEQEQTFDHMHISDLVRVVEYFLQNKWAKNQYDLTSADLAFATHVPLILKKPYKVLKEGRKRAYVGDNRPSSDIPLTFMYFKEGLENYE